MAAAADEDRLIADGFPVEPATIAIAVRAKRGPGHIFLVTDAMHGIGEAWDCKKVDAYQERRGCDICIRLLNEMRRDLRSLPASAPERNTPG